MMHSLEEEIGTGSNSNGVETTPGPSKSISEIADNGFLSELEDVKLVPEVKCATWSEHPETMDWEIVMMLDKDTSNDINARIGFTVMSNRNLDREAFDEEEMTDRRLQSRHEFMDLPMFIHLLDGGCHFTKLELEGDFFNNVYLCPEDMSPNFVIPEFITIPNLKTLSIKAKISLPLKGLDDKTQHKYYTIHRDHCKSLKSRAAKNLWYIFNALECPILTNMEIMDCMEWEDQDLKDCGFYYWDQPLISFLQRHSPTLTSLKTSPIIAMHINGKSHGSFDDTKGIPTIEDALFWMKLRLEDFSLFPESQREITFQVEVEKMLRPWRQFLQFQNRLKTLIWINDVDSPWTLTRRDFVNLAQQNTAIESIMVAVHGDEKFRKAHGLPEQQPPVEGISKDYQLDAAMVHGMTTLRILSIGCYGKDPQAKNFTLSNLHLLPGTLETIQFFGIRVMATELESLAKLPRLRNLTLVQEGATTYTEEDELNGNIEGVTDTVFKALVLSARTLDKLVIIGFPISASKVGISAQSSGKSDSSPQSTGWFGGLFGMCAPTLVESEDPIESTNGNHQLESLAQYSEPLQALISAFSTVGNVSDISSDDSKEHDLMTMLTIG